MLFSAICACCPYDITFIVQGGCGFQPLSGATVSVTVGGDTLTCTTDESGECTLKLARGTYTVTASAGGDYADTSETFTVTGTRTVGVIMAYTEDSGLFCPPSGCPCQPAPTSIFVTGSYLGVNVSDTLTYGPRPAGLPGPDLGDAWWGANVHTEMEGIGVADFWLVAGCNGNQWALLFVNAFTGGSFQFYAWCQNDPLTCPDNSCSPFNYPSGGNVGLNFGVWTLAG